ncbi:mucin-binding protein [Weissella confusa]|uniref:mucin-binding protein n=1 Tax=Weissella confusa TaxID=1583 RepID=UPI001F553902|nr:LPXTG cell wall anchor domain-containing protein [Weissella confusa]
MSSADSLQSVAPSSSQSATVLGADDSTTEDETEADGVTVSVNTAITIPNKESFTGSDYGLSSTVTVTYVDKYLWINLPASYNFNSIDMDALKAYAVRNRMVISFLQEGEQEKDTTTGLTEAQQATFDMFNKDAFNLLPATEVMNDNGMVVVYWPDSTEASQTFDSVDHDDIRVWAETNGLDWAVASEAWRRTQGQTLPTGDSVANSSNLPAYFQKDTNLLNYYYYAGGFTDTTGTKWLVGVARNVTTDPWGTKVVSGSTVMLTSYNDSGITGRQYVAYGGTLIVGGTTFKNNIINGTGDYEVSSGIKQGTTAVTNWRMAGINVFATAADANYYYAIDNGDGTYTKTTDRIPVNTSAGQGSDAKVNQLIGGTGGGYDDEFTVTSDVLPGYQLVPSLTQVSAQKSVTTNGSGTSMTQTVTGAFTSMSTDAYSIADSRSKYAIMDPNNPFNLALIRAYGFDVSAVPKDAVIRKFTNQTNSANYTTIVYWPAVDANGNVTSMTQITWSGSTNVITFTMRTAGATTVSPNLVKTYTIPDKPLTFYLATNTATGATSVVAATSQPTTSGMTYAKITGDLYKTCDGKYTLSATDAFGNANAVISTPDWADEDRNGSIDGGSFLAYGGTGLGDLGGYIQPLLPSESGVNFYYVAAPQLATVGLQTAVQNADGTFSLANSTSIANTAGVSNYNNATAGQSNSALQGVTGAQIGVKTTASPNNDWSTINTKVPGYTYVGFTLNGGDLQSAKKSDGTYALPSESAATKYNATAGTSKSGSALTDSAADAIVLYYVKDTQQAQIKFVMADGTTAPANVNLSGKTGEALSTNIASSIPAGYHIDTSKTTTTGSPAMTLSGTSVSGTYDTTNNNLSTTDSSLQTMTITLVADKQTVTIHYIDVHGSEKTEGWTAADGTEITDWTQTVTGDTGKTYTNVLQSVAAKGYTIVAQDAGSRSGTYDNDTATDQTYYVYLDHNTVDVEGGKDGNAKWEVKSTVRYFYEDNTVAAAANIQTTTFLATVTYDAVTGEELYDTWNVQSYTFSDVDSPVIQGYIADLAQAGAATVSYDSASVGFRVTYKALGAWTPSFPDTTPDNPPTDVTYPNDPDDPTQPDRTNPSVPVVPYVPGYTPELPDGTPLTPVNPSDPTGGYLPPNVPEDPTTDTTIVYHANEQKVTVNYIYVADDGTRTVVNTETFSGKSNADYTHELWDYEKNPDQVYNVILAIGTESVPGGKDDDPNQTDYTKTITRTIHYVDQDGNQMVDANGDPVPDSFIDHTFTATVTYKVDSNVPISVEWPNDSATFAAVKSPVITGYVADVTQVDADQIDHNDTSTEYTVTYKPMGSWTPSFPPNTENVPSDPIQYPNDPNNPTDNLTPHDPAEPGEPVIPYVPGYTPEGPDGTPLKPVDPENPSAGYIPPAPTDPTGDTTINYTRNTQQVIVRYIDDTTDLEVNELRQTFSGETDQAYTNTLSDYVSLGYTYVSSDKEATAGTYDRDDTATQVYLVHLTHGTVVVDGGREDDPNHDSYTSTVTSTIHYIYESDKSEAKPDSVQKKTFTATVTYDAVNGEVLSIVWPAESQNFDDVQTPVIDGYYASEGSVAGDAVDYNDANREETVTYTKLGSWIPHVPDLPEDEQLKTRVYPNDPNDASKVWTRDDPNYVEVPVPYIPGYTPTSDGSSVPLEQIDPNDVTKGYYPPAVLDNLAADTPIYYVAHPQTLVVVYVDISSGTEVEVTSLQQTLTGTTNAAYTNTLSDYAARGYVLVNQDATATAGNYDNVDNVTQFAYVYLDHGTVVVTPDTPGDPGSPMYPDVPDTPVWPEGTGIDSVKQTINGLISYQYANGDEVFPDVTRTVTFERSITLDAVTGEQISTTDWVVTAGDDDWPETPSPVKDGYYADISDILAVTIAPGDFDRSYMVTYYPMGQYVPVFPEGTENVPSDPITYPNDPDNPGDPLEPGQETPDTPGDTDNPTLPYVPGFTPEGPDGTPLEPVDPNNPSAGYWPPATPTDNPGGGTTITYTANEQKATVTVIDDTTGNTLKVVDLTGKSDETDAYRTATDIATYERAGYVWVSDDYPTGGVVYDRVDDTDQPFTVHLKQATVTVDPSSPKEPGTDIFTPGDPVDPSDPSGPTYPESPYTPGDPVYPDQPDGPTVPDTPGDPGTPVDPDNPSGPTWPAVPTYPAGVTTTDLNETVNRTITYVDEAGNTVFDAATDKVSFTRTATVDAVTGEVTYGAWVATGNDTTFDAVSSPVKTGYYADKEVVAETTGLTATTGDETVQVVYKPMGQWVPSFPAGTENVPSDPTTYPNDPAHADTPLEPGDSNTNVPGTPDNPTMPYVPGFTPQGPDGTPLEPVTPGSPEGGYWPPATPTDNPGGDTVVTYVADEQKATITYHDVTTDTDLSVDTIDGHSDETSSYTTAQRIAMYEQQGYRLVNDGYPGTDFTFDRDTATDQAFIVQLERITQTITPDDPKTPSSPIFTPGDPVDPSDPSSPTYPEQPGTPGEPIDPDNPSGPTWPATPTYPAGLEHDDLNQTVTREVTYVYDRDGSEAATTATETLTFTRTATLDTVSGDITYGDWIAADSDTTFDEVTSPTIAGYTANRASVAEATGVAATDADTSIEVRYVANEQHATITYIDDNTQQTIVMDDITGQSDGTTTYTTADRIAALQAQGYSLVSDGWPADFVFDTDDDTTQAFEVHLKHATITIDPDGPKTPSSPVYTPGDPVDPDDPDGPTYPAEPGTPGEPIDPNNPSGPTWPATPTYPDGLKTTDLNESVDRTITYVYENGNEAAETVTDNVQFTRTAEYDVVTGTVTYGDWVATNGDTTFDAVESPVITGYYADLTQVDETANLTANSGDENVKVTYKQMGQWVPSFPANTPSVPTDPITYPNDPDDPTQPLEPGAPDYPVVPYVPGFTPEGPDGPLQPVDPTDPSKGYVPPVTPTDNPGEDTTINYVANEQTATITFIDDTTKTDLAVDTITGVSDATSTYTTAERIQAYLAQGYTLVTDDFTFDRDDSKTQAYEVHLKHATITIDPDGPKTPSSPVYTPGDPVDPSDPDSPTYPEEPGNPGDPIDPDNPSGPTWPATPTYPAGLTETDLNESVTQTITYVYADVQEASDPKADTVTFSRTATLDPVTGAVTYGEWIAANSDTTFDAVASPVITGYVVDKQTVAEVTGIQATDADTDPVVTYTAMGQWVPSYPAGTPDVPTDPITYPNDPDDPTQPADPTAPNYPVIPDVPGFTPQGPDGPLQPVDPSDPSKGYVPPATPTDPTQDTTIAYLDKTTGKQLAMDTITGHSDETSTYTTADKIAAYEAAGYVLVSDGYPGVNFTFDREDDYDQTYEVIFIHAVITVDPNDPKTPSSPIFTPGGPVDPDDPTSPTYPVNPGDTPTPTYPGGLTETDLNESVTQTITYKYADGSTAADDATDTVTFSRTATVDAVTGAVTYGDWVAANGDTTFDAVDSPVITGYVADKQTVATVTGIGAKDADTTVNVVYNKMGQWVPSFPADTTNVPSDPMTYPNNPDDPTEPLTPGPENETDPGDPDNPRLPYVPGFTPQGPDGEPLDPVDPSNPSSGYWPPTLPSDPTTDTTIEYKADEQKATITYIDEVTGDTLVVDTITGGSDESSTYTTADRLADYLANGYVLEEDGYPTDFTFDRDTTVTQAYKVTLTHGSQTIDPTDPKTPGTPINPDNPDGPKYPDGLKSIDLNESVTRTITYVDQAGKTMATAVKETIHFTRTATLDTVTGAYTYSAWVPTTVTSMDAVDSPVIAGYVADRQTVAALPDLTATSADVSEKVVYSPIGQYVPSFPSGVTDVPSTPIDYPNNPDDPTTTDTPGEDNPATPGTPDNPTMPYVPGFTPQGPDGEPLDPVDPDNPSSGYWPPAPSETPTEDTTITYTANKQTATITYINDETGSVLAVDTITGGSAENSTYTAYNRIMVYKLAGMMLVSNGYPSHFTFDRDETVDQSFEVHFKGATITVTPDDPKVPGDPIYQPGDLIDPNDPDSPTFPDPLGEPGTPVDPDDPDSPTWPQPPVWPDGVTAEDLREEVNQTITYIYEKDGSTAAKTVTDQVVFTRTITINVIAAQESAQPRARLARAATSSAIVYSDWQAVNGDDTFDAKTSPVIPGYIADRLVVDEVAGMDETSEDDIQQVVYRQLGSWVPSVPQVPGVKTPGEVTYPNDPDDPTKTADPNSPGYPVIPYVPGFTPQGPDGTPLQPVDPKNPSKGYLPPAVPSDPTADTTIVYTVDRQHAKVNFIDQNTKQVLHVEQLSGDSYSKSSYTTAEQIAYYVAQGYVLVRDGYPAGGMTFDADSTLNQTFAVTLAHGTKTVDPNNPGVPGTPIDPNNPDGPKWPAGVDEDHLKTSTTRTIIFRTSDGTIVDTKTQIVTYTRTATVDTVTGEVTYGPWTAPDGSHVPDVAVPGMPGYVADRDLVPGVDIPVGTPNFTEYVTYTVVPEQTTAEVGPNEPVIVPEVLTPHSLAYTAVQSATATTESAASLAYTAEQSAAESATAQHSGVLPYTGSDEQEGAKATGLAMLFGLFLGLFKRRKRKDEAEETSKKHDDK